MADNQPIPPVPRAVDVTAPLDPTPTQPSNATTSQKRTLETEEQAARGNKSCKTDPYRSLGRHYARTIELFIDPYAVIKEGVKRVADIQHDLRPNYSATYGSTFKFCLSFRSTNHKAPLVRNATMRHSWLSDVR